MSDHLPDVDLLQRLRALPAGYRLLGYAAAEEIERLRQMVEKAQQAAFYAQDKWSAALEEVARLKSALRGKTFVTDHPSAPPCICTHINGPQVCGVGIHPNCPQHGYLLVRNTETTEATQTLKGEA